MDDRQKAALRLRTLHKTIAAVCPIDGAYLGDWQDRSTFGYWPSAEATQEQKDAADALIEDAAIVTTIANAVDAAEADETTAETQKASVTNDPDFQDLLDKLKTMTPAQWKSYLEANLTTVAGARAVIYRMGLALMLIARNL